MISDKNPEECDATELNRIKAFKNHTTILIHAFVFNLSRPFMGQGLFYSDHADLHIYKFWQCRHLYSFSCGKTAIAVKIFSIHFIDL